MAQGNIPGFGIWHHDKHVEYTKEFEPIQVKNRTAKLMNTSIANDQPPKTNVHQAHDLGFGNWYDVEDGQYTRRFGLITKPSPVTRPTSETVNKPEMPRRKDEDTASKADVKDQGIKQKQLANQYDQNIPSTKSAGYQPRVHKLPNKNATENKRNPLAQRHKTVEALVPPLPGPDATNQEYSKAFDLFPREGAPRTPYNLVQPNNDKQKRVETKDRGYFNQFYAFWKSLILQITRKK